MGTAKRRTRQTIGYQGDTVCGHLGSDTNGPGDILILSSFVRRPEGIVVIELDEMDTEFGLHSQYR